MRGFLVFVLSLAFSFALPAATVTVNVNNFSFTSNSITVNVGDTVHWVNVGGFHNVVADGSSFPTSGGVSSGWTYDFTFAASGAYPYYCAAHGCCGGAAIGSTMNGVVNVAPAPSDTPTPSPTLTVTPTFSSTGTITPTFTITDTFTSGPSPTESETSTLSPTFSESPTATLTPTVTATPTVSPTFSATSTVTPGSPATPAIQIFDKAPDLLLAPNPLKIGQSVCLYSKDSPAEARWDIYNTGLQRVAHLSFNGPGLECWDTKAAAPGLYYVDMEWVLPDARVKRAKQKVVLWR